MAVDKYILFVLIIIVDYLLKMRQYLIAAITVRWKHNPALSASKISWCPSTSWRQACLIHT